MAEPTTVGMMELVMRIGPLMELGLSIPLKTMAPQVENPAQRERESGSLR